MDVGHVRTTGAIFSRFRDDRQIWANGEYVDDAVIFINGHGTAYHQITVEPNDEVVIVGGFVRRTGGKVPLPFFFQAWRAFVDQPPGRAA